MKNRVHRTALISLAQGGLIAAMYFILTVAIQPAAFGAVQFRVSEMLTILPVFTPAAAPGLAVGCFLSNLFGLSTGANVAGAWDLLLGPMATLGAAFLTGWMRDWKLKGLPVWATLPPVLLNALVVGTELTAVYGGLPWAANVMSGAAGQLAACTVCGLILYTVLEKSGASRIFRFSLPRG